MELPDLEVHNSLSINGCPSFPQVGSRVPLIVSHEHQLLDNLSLQVRFCVCYCFCSGELLCPCIICRFVLMHRLLSQVCKLTEATHHCFTVGWPVTQWLKKSILICPLNLNLSPLLREETKEDGPAEEGAAEEEAAPTTEEEAAAEEAPAAEPDTEMTDAAAENGEAEA